jgi:hypothetical protein
VRCQSVVASSASDNVDRIHSVDETLLCSHKYIWLRL